MIRSWRDFKIMVSYLAKDLVSSRNFGPDQIATDEGLLKPPQAVRSISFSLALLPSLGKKKN